MSHRICGMCGIEKPLDSFNRQASDPLGRQRRCRDCSSAARRAYGKANSVRLAEQARQWRLENPDVARASVESWRARNAEHYKETRRRWEQLNYEARAEQFRLWRAERREEVAAALREWKDANRDKVQGYHRKRRALVRGAAIGRLDLEVLWQEQGGRCAVCAAVLDRNLSWPDPLSPSVDHILPLSKGGAHSQENVRWTCLRCNLRKGDRLDA